MSLINLMNLNETALTRTDTVPKLSCIMYITQFYKQDNHIHVREHVSTALIDNIRSHLETETFTQFLRMKKCPTWTKTDGQSDTYLLVSLLFFHIQTMSLYIFVLNNSLNCTNKSSLNVFDFVNAARWF